MSIHHILPPQMAEMADVVLIAYIPYCKAQVLKLDCSYMETYGGYGSHTLPEPELVQNNLG